VTSRVVTGNIYDKYRTNRVLYRILQRRFLKACHELLSTIHGERVLEVGCGPGDLAHSLKSSVGWMISAPYVGIDIGWSEAVASKQQNPQGIFLAASAYDLPFPARAFSYVVACEIFEHLEDPDAALAEVHRVCAGYLLLSVPWEPVWQFLNLARGAYAWNLGVTPGHVQQFSRKAIRQLVASRFEIIAERRPFPWTMLLAERR